MPFSIILHMMKRTPNEKLPDSQDQAPAMPFGGIAVKKGFIEEPQLRAALARQKQIVEEGGKHEMLGLVMLEMGLLSNAQFIEILKYLEACTGGHVE